MKMSFVAVRKLLEFQFSKLPTTISALKEREMSTKTLFIILFFAP
jgi:hypothetical protein